MTLLLLHAAATLALTGLIWFVQLVHYPLFRFAAIDRFRDFAAAHQQRTSWVVMPLMLIELATALLLVFTADPGARTLAIVGLVLLAVIWLSTALLQVPLHRRLSDGFDADAADRLVRTNWIRTVAWSARAVVALLLLLP